MVSYEVFARHARTAGCEPRQCTRYHWQVRGPGGIINFYPTTRRVCPALRHGKEGDEVNLPAYIGSPFDAIDEATTVYENPTILKVPDPTTDPLNIDEPPVRLTIDQTRQEREDECPF